MWFDTHFHLDSFEKKGILPEMLARAAEAGVPRLAAIGGGDEANLLARNTAAEHASRMVATAGYDRDLAPGWDGDVDRLRPLLSSPEVVAVGECGIDYFHHTGTPAEQKTLFRAMMDLALEFRKPLVVHSRDAEDDTLEMLRAFSREWPDPDRPCAVLHCFTGDREFALRLVDLNLMISFSGILTFKNAAAVREAAAAIPEERMLVETDSPYLAPEPHRGERNEPARVPHVGRVLAEVRNRPEQEVAERTTRNALWLFNIDP